MNYAIREDLTLMTIIIIMTVISVMYLDFVDSAKGFNSFNNSSESDAITRMINPGDRIHIPCSVVTPGGSVQWVQNGKPILLDFSVSQRRHWNISNDGQASLTINRVTKTDEGIWECWELDSMGNAKQKAYVMRLVVTNIPEEPYIELEGRRLSNDAIITVRENTAVTLNCVVRGASPPVHHIFWYLSQHNISHSSKLLMEYSAEEDVSVAISLLVINVTQEQHQKRIICQVFHVSWLRPATVSASLNILYVPAFSITREPGFGFPIMEGMPLSLKCEIDANPLSVAKWLRDADTSHLKASLPQLETNSDGSLNFTSISKNDTGWYRCTTQHEFGNFTSFGYYLNVRTVSELPELEHILRSPLLPSQVSRGTINKESETLKESEPNEAALMKSHEAAKESFQASISNSPDVIINSGLHNKNQERIHGLQQQRKECENINNDNNNGKPVIESINRTVIVLVGSKISLSARFCCSPRPKKVYWIHRHLAVMPQRTIGPYITRELIMASNSMNCFTSSFEIESVKPEDSGDILFVVLNSKGIDNAIVSVNVTVASFSVSKGSSLSSLHSNSQYPDFLLLTIMALTSFMWWTLMSTIEIEIKLMKRFIKS